MGIDKYNIADKLEMAEKERHQIELTADKAKRKRWRELNKIIKHYKSLLNKYNLNEDYEQESENVKITPRES